MTAPGLPIGIRIERPNTSSARSWVAVALVLAVGPGCYTVGFDSVEPVPSDSPVPYRGMVTMSAESAAYTYKVRSAAAGAANTFTIEVGKVLQMYADAYIPHAFPSGPDVTIDIRIDSFSVHDFEAHIGATFAVTRSDEELFRKTYQAAGTGYFAQTVWGAHSP